MSVASLSYTETTLLINRQCLQDGRLRVTCFTVHICKLNMVQQEDSLEKRLQGNKDANSDWAKLCQCFVVQILVRLDPKPDSNFLLADAHVQG